MTDFFINRPRVLGGRPHTPPNFSWSTSHPPRGRNMVEKMSSIHVAALIVGIKEMHANEKTEKLNYKNC